MNEEEMKELLERLRVEQSKPKRATVAHSMRRFVGWVFKVVSILTLGIISSWTAIIATLFSVVFDWVKWEWGRDKAESISEWGEETLMRVID